jgi:hypothetical protein
VQASKILPNISPFDGGEPITQRNVDDILSRIV